MKHFLIIAGVALFAITQAQAVPITYIYTGDFLHSPALSPFDRVTASVTIDSDDWGKEFASFQDLALNYESSRHFPDFGSVTLNAFGSPLSWHLGGVGLFELTIFSQGFADGSGTDLVFSDEVEPITAGKIDYPAGSPSRWTFASVPEHGNTLGLFGISLVGLAFLGRRNFASSSR